MNNYKSKIHLKNKFSYDQQITITELRSDQKMVEAHKARLTSIMKDAKPEELQKQLTHLVIRDNAFSMIMGDIISKSYEFEIDPLDIVPLKEKIVLAYENKLSDEQVINIAEHIIKKDLIFNELAKLWDISVSDTEISDSLQKFYKATNQSIREYTTDKAKFETVRDVILNEKITQEILKRFKVNIDLKKPETE